MSLDKAFRSPTAIELARPAEARALAEFVNRAYRGAAAREGWAHEADLLDGQRTDAATLAAEMAGPGAILVLRGDEGNGSSGRDILACVATRPIPDRGGGAGCYLGMLTVDPLRQGRGLGRRLVDIVEDRAREAGCAAMEITVIHLRTTLIAWYERLGYRLTGRTEPYPYGDARFGLPKRDDLYFVVLEKRLAGAEPARTTCRWPP